MNCSDNVMFSTNNKLLSTKRIYIYIYIVKFISFIKVRQIDIIIIATKEPP